MVYMLATTPVDPTLNSEVERSVKVDNKWQKKVVNQPSVIYSYNQNMGGVDLSDQRVTTYSRLMKGSVWCLKIFFISWNLACQMLKLSWLSHLEMMLLLCLSSGEMLSKNL